ncbi:hypothetical protein [Nocardia aurantiaca]|uniref:Ig-like domain-containing protein n=1 Tax=Nocardia aurantiaca TaxID=2675850 RepID=A0A6I3L4L5_9NOCA|nr:hypothetical protein [Nocardia aurantiaca]MTE15880.1 hypothetical protein [Nocardia aurantiaca]
MKFRRISLVLGACAAVAVTVLGSPLASADISKVDVELGQSGPFHSWQVLAEISPCTTATITFTDNGQPLHGSPVAASCTGGEVFGVAYAGFTPTTLGLHHIVVSQLNSDGSVESSKSQDVNVTYLPCPSTGSAATLICNVPPYAMPGTGSGSLSAGTAS